MNILRQQTSNETIIPWASDFTPALCYYQPKKFAEIGVDFEEISSWEEYIQVAKALKEKTVVLELPCQNLGTKNCLSTC